MPVVIDEVQKQPKLLDVVHSILARQSRQFILTGSSARKLKRGTSNLLAGRAFVLHLYPFSYQELGASFDLSSALQYGLLTQVCQFDTSKDKQRYLQAYTQTYIREEVAAEQLIRDLNPFRRFLEVAAQMNGQLLNVHRLAKDVNVDDKTIINYYRILEDTLLGFFLEPFQHSFRKRLSKQHKFYFIDLGLVHALARTLTVPLRSQTSFYGDLFEQFVIVEIYKLCQYYYPDYRLSFIKTKDNLEIDLVIERPGEPILLIEIKSTTQVDASMLTPLKQVCKDLDNAQAVCLSQDPYQKVIDDIQLYPWQKGLKKLFG